MTEIPVFPASRRLEPGDRPAIEAITRRFLPASDFSFTSLWSWVQPCQISRLHGNLVVRFADYATGEPFYSFLGDEAVLETALTLLAQARAEGCAPCLRLVPESVVAADDRLASSLAVAPDRDNFDYLYAVDNWARLDGSAFKGLRQDVARCRRHAPLNFHRLDLRRPAVQAAILDLFHLWAARKPARTGDDRAHELAALRRLLTLADGGHLHACGFADGERLVGFSISEILPHGDCAVIHFQKTDWTYPGLTARLCHEEGRFLQARSCTTVNLEQDLGSPGLRQAKLALRPARLLRKFTVSVRDDRGLRCPDGAA